MHCSSDVGCMTVLTPTKSNLPRKWGNFRCIIFNGKLMTPILIEGAPLSWTPPTPHSSLQYASLELMVFEKSRRFITLRKLFYSGALAPSAILYLFLLFFSCTCFGAWQQPGPSGLVPRCTLPTTRNLSAKTRITTISWKEGWTIKSTKSELLKEAWTFQKSGKYPNAFSLKKV